MLKLSISLHFFWKNIAQKNQRTLDFLSNSSVFLYGKKFCRLFKFRAFGVQLGKNTHSYGHTGRKRAWWPHLFIAVFECPLYGWQFSAKFEKIWIVHPFTLLDRAIFVWPWKKVSVRRFVICFISQWMKRSKHGLFVFPPKKSCCSMTSKRSIGWFFEINIFGHEVFLPESSLNPTKSHARL